jgi:hypothetical protein
MTKKDFLELIIQNKENKTITGSYKIREFNILNKETGEFIPIDPKNIDYQRYLKWVAQGNTPEPFETQEEIDARLVKEAELAIEKKIEDRMKELAIADLKAKGEIDSKYELTKSV